MIIIVWPAVALSTQLPYDFQAHVYINPLSHSIVSHSGRSMYVLNHTFEYHESLNLDLCLMFRFRHWTSIYTHGYLLTISDFVHAVSARRRLIFALLMARTESATPALGEADNTQLAGQAAATVPVSGAAAGLSGGEAAGAVPMSGDGAGLPGDEADLGSAASTAAPAAVKTSAPDGGPLRAPTAGAPKDHHNLARSPWGSSAPSCSTRRQSGGQ